MTSSRTPVNVLLSDDAVLLLSNLCGVFNMTRKALVAAMSDNYGYLSLEDYSLRSPGAIKVQTDMPEAFVDQALKALKTEKYLAISSIFDAILTRPILDGHMLQLNPVIMADALSESLRWFRLARAVGLDVPQAIEVTDVSLIRLEQTGVYGSYTCFGRFTHRHLNPHRFGFRGTVAYGELYLDSLLPL